LSAERHHVHRAVCGAAWQRFGLLMSQNKNRSFSRDSANRTVQKAIGNRIAEDHDPLIAKPPEDVN